MSEETDDRSTEDEVGSLQPVVSVVFGELKFASCGNPLHQNPGMSCFKIRQANGTALTIGQIWEVLSELSATKHANDKLTHESGAKDV